MVQQLVRPESDWPEPPSVPFKLLHIQRNTSLDILDRLGFDVFIEINGPLEICAPCLYLLAPTEFRCGFALAEHSPMSHSNFLMMTIVDQEKAYEALAEFEDRVRMRARRLLRTPASEDIKVTDLRKPLVEPAGTSEPPSWVTEVIPYEPSAIFEDAEEDYV